MGNCISSSAVVTTTASSAVIADSSTTTTAPPPPPPPPLLPPPPQYLTKKSDENDEYQYWLSKVEEAIYDRRNFEVLIDAPDYIRNNRNIVMTAVTINGHALQFASPSLQNDKDVVMAAVQKNCHAIQYASPSLQNDKDVVMVAVTINGYALRYVSPALQNDKDVVMAAIRHDVSGQAFLFTSPSLRNDKEVVLAAMDQFPDNIKFAHDDNLKRDPDVLIASGMFDESHVVTAPNRRTDTTRKIVFSTRFSLTLGSHSQATRFTALLKQHEYIIPNNGNFKIYAPNAFDKKTCDPEWTNFDWPCRGTIETCKYDNVLKEGRPTDDCCWRFSFRNQLQEAKDTQGFMLQLIEADDDWGKGITQKLGNGQRIELDMANTMNLKIFQVYRPTYDTKDGRCETPFEKTHIDSVTWEISQWYSTECQDMSVTVIRFIRP